MHPHTVTPATTVQAPMSMVQTTAGTPNPVTIQSAPVNSAIRTSYPHKQALILASIQVAVGILCIVFQVSAIAIRASLSFVGTGIWCGIFFILSGSFGIVSGKRRTTGFIVTFMVLSIISAVLTLVLLSLAAAGLSIENEYWQCRRYISRQYNDYYNEWSPGYYEEDRECQKRRRGRVAMNAILILLALVEAIVAIWSSALCCAGTCCGKRAGYGGTVVYYNTAGNVVPGGAVVVLNPGQALPQQMVYTTPMMQGPYVPAQGTPTVMSYPTSQGTMPPPYTTLQQTGYSAQQPGAQAPPAPQKA